MEYSHCNKCNTTKNVTDFSPSKGVNSHRNSPKYKYCKICSAAIAREWRKNNKNYQGSGVRKHIPKDDLLLYSAISSRLIYAKGRANKRNQIIPNLTKDYLYTLYKSQNGLCALSGHAMSLIVGDLTCLSLDKIDPDLGYVEGNVQWLMWCTNRAKGELSSSDFIALCEKIVSTNQKVQRLSKA